jgi:hypothetical protein
VAALIIDLEWYGSSSHGWVGYDKIQSGAVS